MLTRELWIRELSRALNRTVKYSSQTSVLTQNEKQDERFPQVTWHDKVETNKVCAQNQN